MSSKESRRGASQPSVVLWLGVSLISMIILQRFSAKPAELKLPGEARGDVVLAKDALPGELGEWKMVGFKPAPDPKNLPKGQYWWVHQWMFKRQESVAVVSLDQLGEDNWHELTYCYRNQDRIIEERVVHYPSDGSGGYVTALLRNPDQSKSFLVFSVFYEDGSWVSPPSVSFSQLNQKLEPEAGRWKILERLNPVKAHETVSSGHTRALQCQILADVTEENAESLSKSIVQLHLKSRMLFRSHWLKHAETLSSVPTAQAP